VGNLEYDFPLFQCIRKQACVTAEGRHFQQQLYDAVCCTHAEMKRCSTCHTSGFGFQLNILYNKLLFASDELLHPRCSTISADYKNYQFRKQRDTEDDVEYA
jgi:hypothetical protein